MACSSEDAYWQKCARPSYMIAPEPRHVYQHGTDDWFWLVDYGHCAGIGPTPEAAYLDFDRRWEYEHKRPEVGSSVEKR